MANDYVGRYGAALRQLTALEQPALPSAVSPNAPQPTQGAFGQPAGMAPPQAAGPAFASPAAAPQAMPPAAPPQAAMPSKMPPQEAGAPMSATQLYKDMPDDVKADLEKQIEGSGHDIDEVYAQKVASGEIQAPKKEPSKRDKLGYIAEVALRTISNLSRQNTQGAGDWADAVLETDARRGALDERNNTLFRQGTAGAFERQDVEQVEAGASEDAHDGVGVGGRSGNRVSQVGVECGQAISPGPVVVRPEDAVGIQPLLHLERQAVIDDEHIAFEARFGAEGVGERAQGETRGHRHAVGRVVVLVEGREDVRVSEGQGADDAEVELEQLQVHAADDTVMIDAFAARTRELADDILGIIDTLWEDVQQKRPGERITAQPRSSLTKPRAGTAPQHPNA